MSLLRVHDDSAEEHHSAHEFVTSGSQGQIRRVLVARSRTEDRRKHHLYRCVLLKDPILKLYWNFFNFSATDGANDSSTESTEPSTAAPATAEVMSSAPTSIAYSKKSQLGISKKKRYAFDESVCKTIIILKYEISMFF